MLHQVGKIIFLPNVEDTQRFIWEMTSEDRNRESQAQKILGGNQNFSSKAMVDDHVQGEVDPSYLYDQVPLKVIPEGSP